MSAQEEMPEDTVTGSPDINSTLEQQKREVREKNRQRALIYRQRRRQKERNLKANYQLLEANYQLLEANYQIATRHNILLAVKVERFKSMCQQLITTLIQHQTNSERRSPEYEHITPNNLEETREEEIVNMSTNNEAPSILLEDSQSIRDRINNQPIQYEETTMRAINWVNHLETQFSTAPNEL